ncbi:MAG: PH domain-containing protein [Thermoanaerobaculia bacterium]
MPAEPLLFRCTPGGLVAAGRRRLKGLLATVALLMLAVAGVTLWSGRLVPGLLAAAVAAAALFIVRISGDLELLCLEVTPDLLTVQTRRRWLRVPLPALAARRLRADEIGHVEGLATAGGVVASSGGFDSHRLGEFDLYASDLANAVLVEGEEIRVIVTPDTPEEFLASLPTTAGGNDWPPGQAKIPLS